MKKKVNVKGNIRRMALLVAGCVVMGGMAASQTGGNMAYAMTKEEAERQKDDASENEKNAKDVLDSLEEQQNKIVQDVADLDAKMTSVQTQITSLQEQTDELQTEIDTTQKSLDEAQKAEDEQYEAMKQRIQYLYEEGETEYVDALLKSISFSDLLNKSEYIDQISEYDQRQLAKLIKTKTDIANYEAQLESDLRQVESVKTDLESNEAELHATDTSQKLAIRFGETIKAYEARGLDKSNLILIPLVLAGYARYLKGIDDNGQAFEPSTDPLLAELQAIVAPLEVKEGEQDFSCLKKLYSRVDVFGVDLYAVGLGEKIEAMAKELFAGPGAVRKTLHKYTLAR